METCRTERGSGWRSAVEHADRTRMCMTCQQLRGWACASGKLVWMLECSDWSEAGMGRLRGLVDDMRGRGMRWVGVRSITLKRQWIACPPTSHLHLEVAVEVPAS